MKGVAGNLYGTLPTLPEAQVLWAALWKSSVRESWKRVDARPGRPDERLLALLEDPFESVEDVHDRLARAEGYLRGRGDRRSVFLTVYETMTVTVAAGIADGLFEDAAWVRNYLVAFAERYRTALVGFERGVAADVPLPWRLAFNAAASGQTLLLQDALLAINAHIDGDLPYALLDVGIDPDRAAKRRDHDRIDSVLAQLIDVVESALVDSYGARGYANADDLLGSLDETVTLRGLRGARALTWRNAVAVTDARWRVVRRAVDWRVRAVATGVAYVVLAPSGDPAVLRALEALERDDPPLDALRDAVRDHAAAIASFEQE